MKKNPKYDIKPGDKFNDLTAVRPEKNGPRSRRMWCFRCVCGREIVRQLLPVVNGYITSCGCQKAARQLKATSEQRRKAGNRALGTDFATENELLAELIQRKLNYTQITAALRCSSKTTSKILRDAGLIAAPAPQKWNPLGKHLPAFNERLGTAYETLNELFREQLSSGLSSAQIAEKIECPVGVVDRFIRQYVHSHHPDITISEKESCEPYTPKDFDLDRWKRGEESPCKRCHESHDYDGEHCQNCVYRCEEYGGRGLGRRNVDCFGETRVVR